MFMYVCVYFCSIMPYLSLFEIMSCYSPEVRKTECCGKNLKKNFNSIGLAHL